ncbi:ATP-binding protein [Amycolatopsis sp. NPDC051903]|uniref:ATP-binding protein n=1 Tax=Amycolatopsis sp. NPDC051903 TaxID=3363936 RepID=UPI0037B60044
MARSGDLDGAAEPELRVCRPARTDDITGLRHDLAGWLRALDVPGDLAGDVELAAYEAMINTADHAYPKTPGDVELTAHHEAGLIRVTVTDHGRWLPPTANPGPLHGRGLPLIRALPDDATVDPTERGTTVTMTWYPKGPGST